MAEKKVKIYNLAKELNLASDTILEFLHKKGFEAKNHMSTVTDDMLHAVMGHFKKEKDVADRHNRKVQEFRTSRKKDVPEKSEKKAAEDVPAEETPVAAEDVPVLEPESLPEAEAAVFAEAVEAAPTPEPEAEAPVGDAGVEVVAVAEIPEAPVPETPAVPAARRPQSPLEALQARQTRGLTIKGKLDLTKAAKPAPGAESEADKKKKKKKKIRTEPTKVATKTPTAREDEESKAKKKKKGRRAEVNVADVDRAIRETMTEMTEDAVATARAAVKKKKKERREEAEARLHEEQEQEASRLRVTEFVSVGELANMMRVSVAEVIQKVMGLGIMVSINQRLDKDTITLVADEFGFQVAFQDEFTADELEDYEDDVSTLVGRPPVVTIMGHVDHGKTSLLDHIRSANVVAGESGGITQHIGAYEVQTASGRQITFLDTPGHEAFTAMRARGAQVTDIVVLVVAADDAVMPQTLEAISHAQAASVPMVVAINKIDKPDANPERIKQQLAERGLLVEEYGGKCQVVELSAKTGKNIDLLLEKIGLEADVLDLKANPDRQARAAVVEAELDKGRGITATVLVQKGTLRIGDAFVVGIWSGRVRAMFDERGQRVEAAGPSRPVQVIGFEGIPQAGDPLIVVEDEREAREVSLRRQQLKREQDFRQNRRLTLDDISKQIKDGQVRDLPVIVKADVDGSAEALADSLMKLSTEEVKVQVIHKAVGGISESDVLLAVASQAVIIGFHVRPNLKARQLAEQEDIDIRLYSIIYDAINDVKSALEGMLAPTVSEQITATVEVRETFKISKVGTIAGCYVRDGKIHRNARVRLVRDGVQVFDGSLASLKRFKDDVREVEQGYECGLHLEGFNDLKVGDVIEAYQSVETKRKLS
ncbi:MAG: translation initiation factor IF-2 [Bacteroidetes bacterium]|jgi:translation initiation factor IF-2|nr:translation initiation factor IF-2 [Bacteroidota bacterium]